MKKNILFLAFLAITLSSIFFIQCHKGCESKNLGELKFSPTDLAIVPYNGTEHLIFRDSLGDSICYDSTGIRSTQERWPIYETGDPECPGDNYYCDVNYTHFNTHLEGNIHQSMIWFDLEFIPFSANMKKNIYFHVFYQKTKTWFFSGDFNFENLALYNTSQSDAIVFSINDSLMIGPRKFYNVYILEQIKKPDKAENLKYLYYTISNGIVGFKTEEGHLWYLSL